jgi:hypothetical protein
MASTIVSVALALAVGSSGGLFGRAPQGGRILGPGPGYGWGFPNGNPDGYGWFDPGDALPLGADRTPDYFFRRYWAVPVDTMCFPTYYNPYVMRGQRYIPYTGCGGGACPGYGGSFHPASGPPSGSAETPVHPYNETIGSGPVTRVPRFSGRVEAPPVNSGGTGLTP